MIDFESIPTHTILTTMDNSEIAIRVIVTEPLEGVSMQIQRGRDQLLAPAKKTKKELSFDFDISVNLDAGSPNFLGKFAQGPKNGRFIYLNSGTYAGQGDSCWGRRAKISLMNVTAEQVRQVLSSPGSRLEISIKGRGTDDGPICASVKPHATSGWKVSK
jgi:hypothetical protein